MSGTIIKIKYSTTNNQPGSGALETGELAYSFTSTSQKLFIGDDSTPENDIVVGGKYFMDMLDHSLGVLTASSAILTDSGGKINELKVDNIHLDGNTITTLDTNGDLTLGPHGSGDVNINANTNIVGTVDVTGILDVDNVRVDGNTISVLDTNGNLILTPNGTGIIQMTGNTVVEIPSGPTSSRPSASTVGSGTLRYNETDHRFEGTAGSTSAWTSIGGVSDTDKDTYITAEETTDDDTLRLYVGGSQDAYLDSTGLTIANALSVGGSITVTGDLVISGTTTTVNSTVTELTDPVMVLGKDSTSTVDSNDRGINFKYGDGSAIQTGFFGMDMQSGRFSYQKVLGTGDSTPDDNQFSSPWGDAEFDNLFLSGDATIEDLILDGGNITTVSSVNLTLAPATGSTFVTGSLAVSGALTAASLALTTDLAVVDGGTGIGSFTGDGFFISNTAGTAISFITGAQYDILQFNASGVPYASSTIDGGTF
jgi:hypothetical protein